MGIRFEVLEQKSVPDTSAARVDVRDEIENQLNGDFSQISNLSPEKQQRVDDLVTQINLHDHAALANYGKEAQRELGISADRVLKSAFNGSADEVGELLEKMFNCIEAFNKKIESTAHGVFRSFGSAKKKTQTLLTQYTTASTTLEQIKKQLIGYRIALLAMDRKLEATYESNLACYKELAIYIAAGQRKLEETRRGELENLLKDYQTTGDEPKMMAYDELGKACDFFAQHLQDLEIAQSVCFQTALQIRMMQSCNNLMVCKLDGNVENTLPIWKQKVTSILIDGDLANLCEIESSNQKLMTAIKEIMQVHDAEIKTKSEAESQLRKVGEQNGIVQQS